MDNGHVKGILENVMLVADGPIGEDRLAALFEGEMSKEEIHAFMLELKEDYASRNLDIVEVAEGWRLQTRPDFAAWITRFYKMERGHKLSRASLETLSIIAYRQPITRAEVDEMRGVDSGGVLRGLVDKNLVKTMGRRKAPGRPMMYGTTKRFLEYFGLARLADLPTMEEFQEEIDAKLGMDNPQEALDLAKEEEEKGIEETVAETEDQDDGNEHPKEVVNINKAETVNETKDREGDDEHPEEVVNINEDDNPSHDNDAG